MAETLIFSTEKTLKDYGDKVEEGAKKEINEKLEALKNILAKGESASGGEEIKKASDELSQAIQKVGSELYKAQQESQKQDEKNPDIESESSEDKKTEEK